MNYKWDSSGTKQHMECPAHLPLGVSWNSSPKETPAMRATLSKLFTAFFSLLLCAAIPAQAQTSVALSVLGSFPSSTSGYGIQENPASQAGFMLELRHISNPLMGYDVSYSFHRANQEYTGPTTCPTSTTCTTPFQAVRANAQAVTLNWVVSFPLTNVRVFALAGGGFKKFDPSGTQSGNTQSQTKGVFDYGAGLDWGLLPHLGLRFQYRGYVYRAPALATSFSPTDQFTKNAEPMVGAYFNF
jgi:opacity protein-like surface antigen